MFDLIGAALSGGLTSLVGLGVQHYMDYKKAEMNNAHEIAVHALTMAEMDKEVQLADTQGKAALEIERERGANEAFNSAVESQAQMSKGASQWVVNFCALTRPVLTYLLDFMAFGIVIFNPAHALASEIVYMASTATIYWFGDRARKK